MVNVELKTEVEQRLEEIRADSARLMRYDRNGDGVIDDQEWEEVRRVVTAEVQTEWERAGKDAVVDGVLQAQANPNEVLRERYELQRELGRGGQGRTFLAHDRSTGEPVAVKELDLNRATSWKAIDLFEREGKALQALSHPAIPAYVEAFHLERTDEAGQRFFLVQEFVEGENLEQLIDGGLRLDETQIREFLAEMLEILSYLHSRSPAVIHRDIKPSNIIRRKGGDRDGRLALIDFGAVQSMVGEGPGGSTIVGTSGYMPLEQLMGRAVPATDLYGLAATAVHLLSHRHPADLPVAGMVLKFRPFVNVSDLLASFLQRLLEPHVEDRFPSAVEARAALLMPATGPITGPATGPAAQTEAAPPNIQFGRPAHEQQGFFSKMVHQASALGGPGLERHEVLEGVSRPAVAESKVESTPEGLHIELARNSNSLTAAFFVGFFGFMMGSIFAGGGHQNADPAMTGLGILILLGAGIASALLIKSYRRRVILEVKGGRLTLTDTGDKSPRREIALEDLGPMAVVTTRRRTNDRTEIVNKIVIEGGHHVLEFGTHLPFEEQQYLISEIHEAVKGRG